MKDLSEIRAEINRVDRELVALFCRRMDCAKAVGEYKKENGVPVLNLDREKEILDRVEEEGGEYGIYTRLMYQNIMELSRALQHKIIGTGKELREKLANATHTLERQDVLVGYQGIEGANSHEASQILFPHAQLRHYKRFDDVLAAVDSGEVRYGVLPVENSTAGSVSAVYDLILKHRFYIVGALDMAIDHCLASLRQSEPEDIEIVRSHPQALSQCATTIERMGWESIPSANTAVAARDVAKEKRLNVAAICSRKAAETYGLKLLDSHIQDDRYNTTRFIVISKELCLTENANKISLCLTLPHVEGALYSLLCRFHSLGLNLTKIESRPIPGKDFEYLFYLDFAGSLQSESVIDLLCQLSEELPEFSFLGNYSE